MNKEENECLREILLHDGYQDFIKLDIEKVKEKIGKTQGVFIENLSKVSKEPHVLFHMLESSIMMLKCFQQDIIEELSSHQEVQDKIKKFIKTCKVEENTTYN